MKKPILILLLLATLAVAWWYFSPENPADDEIATVSDVNVRDMIAERNNANNQENDEDLDVGEEEDLSPVEPDNTVAEISDASATGEIDLPNGTVYTLSDGSSVERLGKSVGDQHSGDVEISEGVLVVNNGNVVGGSFVMDMRTITTRDIDSERLDTTLKSWFNTNQHPTAEFTLLEVGGGSVIGILTMNGISKQVVFPATLTVEDDTVIASADFALDRTEWDIEASVPGISEFIELSLDLTWTQ